MVKDEPISSRRYLITFENLDSREYIGIHELVITQRWIEYYGEFVLEEMVTFLLEGMIYPSGGGLMHPETRP